MLTFARRTVLRAIAAVVATFVVATLGVWFVAMGIGSPVTLGQAALGVLFVSTLIDMTGLALLGVALRDTKE